jgi:hypothetical protein
MLTALAALMIGQVVAQQQYPIASAGGGGAGTSLAAQINPAYLLNPAQNIHPGWTVGPRAGTLPAGDGGNEALLLFLAQQAQHKPCATCANGGAGLATLPQQLPYNGPPPNYGGGGLFGGGSDFLQQYLLFQLLSQNQGFGGGFGGGPRGYLPPIEPRPLIPPQAYCPPVPTPQPIIITSPGKRRGLFR